MEGLLFVGSLLVGPLLTLLVQKLKKRFPSLKGSWILLFICLVVGGVYTAVCMFLPEATVSTIVTYSTNTAVSAMGMYTFFKDLGVISNEKDQ